MSISQDKNSQSKALSKFSQSYIPVTESGCWIWLGTCLHKDGYGLITVGHSQRESAHRFSYQYYNGPIPDGQIVLHRCDVMPCVNPSHLFLGTHRDNQLDKTMKDRQAKGEQNGWAKLTEEQVRFIRASRMTLKIPQLAAQFHIAHSTVKRIWNRKAWKHLTA